MDTHEKLELLGEASTFDVCSASDMAPQVPTRELSGCIAHALMPGGRPAKLLKVLLSSVCDNDCAYCAFRSSRDTRRTAFTPEELARSFDAMHRARLVEGLFLSSGVCHNPVREMDRMLAAVEIVRRRYAFRGYVHLKLLPGVTVDQIEQAVRLADRVSTNLETPSGERLGRLSARKGFETQLLPNLRAASRIVRDSARRLAPSGITTQFVVGAADETDAEILDMSARLYRELRLARAYYSAFTPIPDTPLEGRPPTMPLRQHRLYQSDFLLRRYGFRFDELVFDRQGNLPTERDPKEAWAHAHPEAFPLEVNRADRESLLRVPGIGPVIAGRILEERRKGRLTDLSDLRRIGANAHRAAPYILLDGHRPAFQLSLWSEMCNT